MNIQMPKGRPIEVLLVEDSPEEAQLTMDALRGVNERRAFAEGRGTDDDTQFLTSFLLAALRAGTPTNFTGNVVAAAKRARTKS